MKNGGARGHAQHQEVLSDQSPGYPTLRSSARDRQLAQQLRLGQHARRQQRPESAGDFKYLHTLSIASTVSKEDLQQRYGGKVIAYYPEEGRAIIASNSAVLGSTSLGVQALTAELNLDGYEMGEAGMKIWSTGYGAWSTGYGAWSTGYGAWSTGKLSEDASGNATTFKDNIDDWNVIKLSEAQSLVPELGQGVKVAVLDTGIDLSHPAFAGKLDLAHARDYIDGDSVPQEVNGDLTGKLSAGYGHGTSVASLILQMAPKATILPVRVLDSNGGGDTATVVSAIAQAVKDGADVINLSLGSLKRSAAIDSAVKNAISKGVAVICAAGNSGTTSLIFPAATARGNDTLGNGTLSVGSITKQGRKSAFSSYGSNLEINAPGEDLVAAFPDNRYSKVSGTSFATPLISGVLALAISAGVPSNNSKTVIAMLQNLNSTATAPNDPSVAANLMGYGSINAYAFIHQYR